MTDHYLANYRGRITGVAAQGAQIAFITSHSEGQPTALYRMDAADEQFALSSTALPCGATALLSDGKTLWLAGQDGNIYQSPFAKGKVKALPTLAFSTGAINGLARLAGDRLAVMQDKQLHIVDLKTHTTVQTFDATHTLTALDSHPDGSCLALGDSQGLISVYQTRADDNSDFQLSTSGRVHQGRVLAIRFETNELRFYSSGADKKLFSTHAQGVLQPLDKGRSSNHDGNINAIHLGQERFFTAANDRTIKSWAYSGGQPVTFKENGAKFTALATLTYREKPCLLGIGSDASLRIIALTPEEKFGELKVILHDGYQQAEQLLTDHDPARRERGIDQLASYDDKQALSLLIKHLAQEKDKQLRDHVATRLSQSQHAEATRLLEQLLSDQRNASIRHTAFAGLLKHAEPADLNPYQKALASGFSDIGEAALRLLAKLAKKEPRAVDLLVQALQHKQPALRLLALSLLEKVYPKNSAKASLQALQSNYPGLQRAALIRLFQRRLLDHLDVQRAVLLMQDHADAQLRHTAFLIAILSQKPLTQALKTREPDLARQLQDIENFELLAENPLAPTESFTKQQTKQQGKLGTLVDTLKQVAEKAVGGAPPETNPAKTAGKTPPPYALNKLSHRDFTVLLQGMTNRHADICFLSAFSLAVLEDQRAFGLLLLLSQEPDKTIRAGVCRAFAWLQQADSVQPLELMLNDPEALVRDAAFSALGTLQADQRLIAQRGLESQYEDMHARALKVLLDNAEAKQGKAAQQQTLALIKTALNDPFPAIRQETFKACLNRCLGGDETATLQLLMASRFENVHQEILDELMAKSNVRPLPEWVEPLLLQLFNNHFSKIRTAAFQFATAEKKRFAVQSVLATAVDSEFVDVRQAAFQHIKHKPDLANQAHLEKLVADEDEALRNAALSTLVHLENNKALTAALQSPYDDIQVNAACALAEQGDTQAYSVLHTLLSRDKPHKAHEQAHWQAIALRALKGLAALGDSRAFPLVLRFIEPVSSQNSANGDTDGSKLLAQAAQTLPWVASAECISELRDLQRSEQTLVRTQAGFALALLLPADEAARMAARHDFGEAASVSIHHQLAATLCATPVTPVSLQAFLLNDATRISALLALASHELLLHGDEPVLSTWALSIAQPEVQLFCADLMVCYSDHEARWSFLRDWLIRHYRPQNDEQWALSLSDLQQMAAVLVYADGHTKAHLLSVMAHLDQQAPYKTWALYWQAFKQRYAQPLITAEQQLTPPSSAEIKPLQTQTVWNQCAFGAYLGLVRQEPADYYKRHQILSLRLQSLRSMDTLARQDSGLRDSVHSCFLTLLNHPQLDIRQLAFDTLKASGFDPERLGTTAITSPQHDIARQGLELLTAHYPVKQARQLLEKLIRGDHEALAFTAYSLHRDDNGLLLTAEYALQSQTLRLRQHCIDELAAQYEHVKAQQWLITASTDNDHFSSAISAARHLARHQHPKAFERLKDLLERSTQVNSQTSLTNGLRTLTEARVAEYLLDYLLHNKLNRLPAERLYRIIAGYRHPAVFETLLKNLTTRPQEAGDIIRSLTTISGYDQPIEDYDAEQFDRSWLDKQHPRHADLLVELFNTLLKLERHAAAIGLQQALSWAPGQAVDQAVLAAVPVIAEKYLAQLIEIIVYRAERRAGSVAGLIQVLAHKDSKVQFLAAEGLANHGHAQGFNVLFAAVDYQPDLDYRRRAVLALGKLADARALDKLLELAEDPEHALNEAAIEAIGCMSDSDHQQTIFNLLKTALAKADYYSDMTGHALRGLRWFNTLAAWQLIQQFSADEDQNWTDRQTAVTLLEHHDTPASRDLLLHLLKNEQDEDVVAAAYLTAQKLYRHDDENSLEKASPADAALIQGHHPDTDSRALQRITRHAPTAQLLQLLAADFPQGQASGIVEALGNSLLSRDDVSAEALNAGLQANNPAVIRLIARLIARMEQLTPSVLTNLQEVTDRYYQRWQAQSQQLQRQNNRSLRTQFVQTEQVLKQLIWSSVRHGINSLALAELLSTTEKAQRELQTHSLTALLSLEKDRLDSFSDQLTKSLHHLADSPLPFVNTLAGQLLNQHQQAAELHLSQQAATQTAHQAQALPILIRQQDVATLSAVAHDTQQQDSLRMGAIEGLACILSQAASTALSTLHKNSADQDMAKAAYRALRRQQRNRQNKQNNKPQAAQ